MRRCQRGQTALTSSVSFDANPRRRGGDGRRGQRTAPTVSRSHPQLAYARARTRPKSEVTEINACRLNELSVKGIYNRKICGYGTQLSAQVTRGGCRII